MARSLTAHAQLGVLVLCRHHLREVDDDRLGAAVVVLAQEDVELVEVAVDEAGASEADDQVHQRRVELAGVSDLGDLSSARGLDGADEAGDSQWECVDELHDDAVPRLVNGRRHREAVLVQDLDQDELSHSEPN